MLRGQQLTLRATCAPACIAACLPVPGAVPGAAPCTAAATLSRCRPTSWSCGLRSRQSASRRPCLGARVRLGQHAPRSLSNMHVVMLACWLKRACCVWLSCKQATLHREVCHCGRAARALGEQPDGQLHAELPDAGAARACGLGWAELACCTAVVPRALSHVHAPTRPNSLAAAALRTCTCITRITHLTTRARSQTPMDQCHAQALDNGYRRPVIGFADDFDAFGSHEVAAFFNK